MNLLTLRDIHLAFGGPSILDGINFTLDKGERVCLIGRNGQGKSTLFKLLSDEVIADQGEVVKPNGLKIAYMAQDVPSWSGTVGQIVAEGFGELSVALQQYHVLSIECSEGNMDACNGLEPLQEIIERHNGWDLDRRVQTLLDKMELDYNADINTLSGGQKRRVLLAKALLTEPDILLLDEPTNHLDMENIEWLEKQLLDWQNLTLFFISHDRRFVNRLSTRIVELDRGKLRSYDGNYARYQFLKQLELEAEEQQAAKFDKRLAQEEVWIRQGVKARRTRNEGRVRALKALREEYKARRNQEGNVQFNVQDSQRSGKIVFDINHLTLQIPNRTLVNDFSQMVMRGDKIALVGPNGAGKSTLIKALLGEIEYQGSIKQGTQLEIAYFDQLRNQLDLESTVLQNVGAGSDFVELNGQRKHILSYLQDFLFSPDRARTPVKALSGGEKNRLLLARLMLKPSNLLVMDEPTNDLDMDTLELLEELLSSYTGTLLLISHDREFIDAVATSTWVFEKDATLNSYVGGYEDYVSQRDIGAKNKTPKVVLGNNAQSNLQSNKKAENATNLPKNAELSANKPVIAVKKVKLSFNEQRELETIPDQITQLEEEQSSLMLQLSDGNWYIRDQISAQQAAQRLTTVELELLKLLDRWTQLEEKIKGES